MASVIRHDWHREELLALFALPFPDLLHRAASVHREQTARTVRRRSATAPGWTHRS
jgi:biotin synthase-like enzyme